MRLIKLGEVQISLLGALDGLLIGIALEAIRLIYLREQMNRELAEAAQGKSIGYILEPTANTFLPLLCIIALATASYFVHKYFVSHPKRLLMMWVSMGVLSAMGAYYMAPVARIGLWSFVWFIAFLAVSYLVYYGWTMHPKSPALLWPVVGITAVVIALGVTQGIGLFRTARFELRDPLAWFLCLALIVGINVLFGTILSLVARDYTWTKN